MDVNHQSEANTGRNRASQNGVQGGGVENIVLGFNEHGTMTLTFPIVSMSMSRVRPSLISSESTDGFTAEASALGS